MKKNNLSLETDFTSSGLYISLGICLLIIFGSILMLYLSTPPQKIYAARINGTPITNDDFRNSVERMKSQYVQILKTDFTTPQGQEMLANIEKTTLDSLLEREILLQAADKMAIVVDDSVISTELAGIKEKNFANDEKAFKDALRANNLSISKLEESIRKDKTIEKVREKIIEDRLKITDAEKKAYFDTNPTEFAKAEQVKASHILVKDEKLANDIYKQLQSGAKFEDLSTKHSTDPGSKAKGGDLGYFEKGKMVPEFDKEAWRLKVGELSKPVKSQFGYHIIKKTDYKPAGKIEYKDAVKQITESIKTKKGPEVIENFVKEEKAKGKLEIFIARLAQTPVPSLAPTVQPQGSAAPAGTANTTPTVQPAENSAKTQPESKVPAVKQ